MLRSEGIAQWLLASWILQLQGTTQHSCSGTLMIQDMGRHGTPLAVYCV